MQAVPAELQALIWDVDGTIAETERDCHRVAFNQAFEALGLPWQWDLGTYGELLRVAGGRERLLFDMSRRADAPPAGPERHALARELHQCKNRLYPRTLAQRKLPARPGVMRLVAECQSAGVQQAVATTSSRSNVAALFASLWGAGWEDIFSVVVCAEDAAAKKPDPTAYTLALQRLGVRAAHAMAIEDSPSGLKAALGAGLACGVTRGAFFAQDDFPGALWLRDDLDTPTPMTLATLLLAGSGNIA